MEKLLLFSYSRSMKCEEADGSINHSIEETEDIIQDKTMEVAGYR